MPNVHVEDECLVIATKCEVNLRTVSLACLPASEFVRIVTVRDVFYNCAVSIRTFHMRGAVCVSGHWFLTNQSSTICGSWSSHSAQFTERCPFPPLQTPKFHSSLDAKRLDCRANIVAGVVRNALLKLHRVRDPILLALDTDVLHSNFRKWIVCGTRLVDLLLGMAVSQSVTWFEHNIILTE